MMMVHKIIRKLLKLIYLHVILFMGQKLRAKPSWKIVNYIRVGMFCSTGTRKLFEILVF